MVDFRVRVSLNLIPCREIEILKRNYLFFIREYKVYIKDKVSI